MHCASAAGRRRPGTGRGHAVIRASLAALWIYPVKSCRGIELSQATVGVTGFAHDREWMIVDGNGRFVTQREYPQMARIATALGPDFLVLAGDGFGEVRTALAPPDGDRIAVRCWRFETRAVDCGPAIGAWLSDFLGTPARLVRFPPDTQRLCNPQWAGTSGAHTLFSDGYPFLVLSEESVADLAQRMGLAGRLPIDRFRPNIVLRGLSAYEEDYVDTLEVDGVRLKLVKPCTRCTIPEVDQATGAVSPLSPLQTLQQYRMDTTVGGATLGINAILETGSGAPLRAGGYLQVVHRFD